MKKNKLFNSVLAAIAIAATTVACTNDDVLNQPQTPNAQATITATMPAPADTRMSVTDTGTFGAEKLELRWQVGDEIFVCPESGTTVLATYKIAAAGDIDEGGKTATFTAVGDVSGVNVTNGKIYFADTANDGGIIVPTYQSANDAEPFEGQKLPMKAEGIDIVDGACPSTITFQHMAYVLKFSFAVDKTESPKFLSFRSDGSNRCFQKKTTGSKFSTHEFTLNDYDFSKGGVNRFNVYVPLFPVAGAPLGDNLTVKLHTSLNGDVDVVIGTFKANTKSTTENPFQAGLMYTARIQYPGGGADGTLITSSEYNDAVRYADGDSTPFTGEGTEATPYLINSALDLRKLIFQTESGIIPAGKHFKLTTDIHVTADNWLPLSNGGTSPFIGTFDGNGHVITGTLKLDNASIKGFFGTINDNTGSVVIKNLTIAANIENAYESVGAIIGNITMGSGTGQSITISNCHFTGNLTGEGSLGGIIGSCGIEDGATGTLTIENCTTRGTITGTGSEVGGIAGQLNNNCIINNCTNYAKITGDENIGGIVGNIDSQEDNTKITACTNRGSIDGNLQLGGIVGYEETAQEVDGNANYGTIGNPTATYVGGIAGFGDDKGIYTNNHNYSPNIYGSSEFGGIWGDTSGGTDDGTNLSPNFP